MAAIIITAAVALSEAVKDPDLKIFDLARYTGFVLDKIRAEQSYQAQLMTAGYWNIQSPAPLVLWNPTFDASTGEHTLYAAGGGGINPKVSLSLTGGTDTRSEITITGAPVDWGNLVAEVLTYIANFRALEYSQSIEGSSVSPETSRRELLRQADIYRGVVCV